MVPEHTPAPTAERAIYGFILFLGSSFAFVLFIVWAYVPTEWMAACHLTYWPQKYWALAIPVYLMMPVILLGFCVYPGLNLMMTPPPTSLSTITDKHCRPLEATGISSEQIPPIADIPLTEVCQLLYLDSEKCQFTNKPEIFH